MSDLPLISVVMPLLNAARHLPRSLGSLAEQSRRDFEVVLVDGGSNDETVALATRLLSEATISHCVAVEKGSGIYEAMNHGVALARGDWLYVMGADDRLISADSLAAMTSWLQRVGQDVLVVHGDVWIEDPGYCYGQRWDLPRFMERNLSHQSAFYRRSMIQDLGIEYNPRYSLYADWDYNIRLFAKGRFQYVPVTVASYACTGASSQRMDEIFMAEKESNTLRYFGWRACWLLPPHRFALGCGSNPSIELSLQLLVNRLIWTFKRRSRQPG
jgi:glycosyltransferase involved in cell wall biosynthesis